MEREKKLEYYSTGDPDDGREPKEETMADQKAKQREAKEIDLNNLYIKRNQLLEDILHLISGEIGLTEDLPRLREEYSQLKREGPKSSWDKICQDILRTIRQIFDNENFTRESNERITKKREVYQKGKTIENQRSLIQSKVDHLITTVNAIDLLEKELDIWKVWESRVKKD